MAAASTQHKKRSPFRNQSHHELESDSDDSDIELDELKDEADAHLLKGSRLGKQNGHRLQASSRFSLRAISWRWRKRTVVMVVFLLTLFGLGTLFGWTKYTQTPPDGHSPPWYPSPRGGTLPQWANSYEKAAKMVRSMTLAEKVNITTGTGWAMGLAVGNTGPAIHVGFPSLALQDGPLGIRFADNATAFPAGVTVGATWNKQLMYRRGQAHGKEAREKGINVLLGPSVGPLGRMPAGGRNWEGFGSDPYLQGIAAAETIRGIQGEGVMATVKHFVANEQEHFRQPWAWGLPHAVSSNVDDRTLHELYAWPFANAVKAGVASIMCSYNMVNNSYACANSKLLNGILKDELGFQGFVMSDWLAQQSGVASALAGLDMTMPGDGLSWVNGKSLWGPHLSRAVLNGSLPVARLDDMVVRIVASWYQLGQDDLSLFDRKGPNFSSWTNAEMGYISDGSSSAQDKVLVNQFVNVQSNHSSLAKELAVEGTVLLKNNGILPLNRSGAVPVARRQEGGAKAKVGVFGEDAGPGLGPNHCADRACNQGTLASGWGSGAVEFPFLVTPEVAFKQNFDSAKVDVTYQLTNEKPRQELLAEMDVCIVFANSDSGEGYLKWGSVAGDRNDLFLQKGGDDLIIAVADGCGDGKGKTIVVVHAVGPVVMERWIDHAGIGAVLAANLPGEESGNALATIIFGDVSPSGKLPYTIGKSLEDYGHGGQVMYSPNGLVPQQHFEEGVYIDYRHFDKFDISPRFEFGFGLSYTTFSYSNLRVTQVRPKTRLAGERRDEAKPPSFDDKIPDVSEAIFPRQIRKLNKYIYPYIKSASEIRQGSYPYPKGYHVKQPPSAAGGGEGGHPDLWETHVSVGVDISNDGRVGGKAVPQLYLSFPDTEGVDFPVRVLRGFDKMYLAPGETGSVQFNLTRRDLSYWDTRLQNWVMPGDDAFTISIGASSRDMKLSDKW